MGGCTAHRDILGSRRPAFWTIRPLHTSKPRGSPTLTSKPLVQNLDARERLTAQSLRAALTSRSRVQNWRFRVSASDGGEHPGAHSIRTKEDPSLSEPLSSSVMHTNIPPCLSEDHPHVKSKQIFDPGSLCHVLSHPLIPSSQHLCLSLSPGLAGQGLDPPRLLSSRNEETVFRANESSWPKECPCSPCQWH